MAAGRKSSSAAEPHGETRRPPGEDARLLIGRDATPFKINGRVENGILFAPDLWCRVKHKIASARGGVGTAYDYVILSNGRCVAPRDVALVATPRLPRTAPDSVR